MLFCLNKSMANPLSYRYLNILMWLQYLSSFRASNYSTGSLVSRRYINKELVSRNMHYSASKSSHLQYTVDARQCITCRSAVCCQLSSPGPDSNHFITISSCKVTQITHRNLLEPEIAIKFTAIKADVTCGKHCCAMLMLMTETGRREWKR